MTTKDPKKNPYRLLESLLWLAALIFACSFGCHLGAHAAAMALGVCP